MQNFENFIKFLSVSPSSGLIIKDNEISQKIINKKLLDFKFKSICLNINHLSDEKDFWQKIEEAIEKKMWLILDIEQDIPAWLYQQLRALSGNGHLYKYQASQEMNLTDTPTRILALISDNDLEKSVFNNLISCFGIVFRNKK